MYGINNTLCTAIIYLETCTSVQHFQRCTHFEVRLCSSLVYTISRIACFEFARLSFCNNLDLVGVLIKFNTSHLFLPYYSHISQHIYNLSMLSECAWYCMDRPTYCHKNENKSRRKMILIYDICRNIMLP